MPFAQHPPPTPEHILCRSTHRACGFGNCRNSGLCRSGDSRSGRQAFNCHLARIRRRKVLRNRTRLSFREPCFWPENCSSCLSMRRFSRLIACSENSRESTHPDACEIPLAWSLLGWRLLLEKQQIKPVSSVRSSLRHASGDGEKRRGSHEL